MKLNFFGREIVLRKEVVVIGASALLLLGCLAGYIFLRDDSEIIIEGGGRQVSAAVAGTQVDTGESAENKASDSTSGTKAADSRTEGTNTAGGYAMDGAAKAAETICVYVVGCVKYPGIVTIGKGQMINDAVNAAGGLTNDADAENINLVYSLNENVMLNIKPKQTQADQQTAAPGQSGAFSGSGVEIVSGSGSSAVVTGGGDAEDGSASGAGSVKNLVNINTAGADELDTLPGVGEATARDIIAFREKNGRFDRIEDIMKVPRIKQNRFDSIKDFITVD